ncbi:MAG: HD domain-containing protein [Clostridia bacterium]|nr:HD domain-containing protein [Clostridia bacterium]
MEMLPKNIDGALAALEDAGYEAYIVGGSVRDRAIGREVSDYDVTTSALPEEVEKVFAKYKVIETGIAHGTVTVVIDGSPIEITTFRSDGEYLDSRHPESVTFTRKIEDDLARRDFTMNSIAVDRRGKTVDPYGGMEDISRGVVRCTGDPDTRFGEDALRIIRALRFSSTLGFEIESGTAESIHKNRGKLLNISVERVYSELKKLLCGKDVYRILTDYSDVICTLIPEMTPAIGFDQKSKYHCYDVYTHIAKSVEAIEPDPVLRLSMLFHDIGKPYVCTEEDGVRHFKGHPDVSEKIAERWFAAMHSDAETARLVVLFCKLHDRPIVPEKKPVKRLLTIFTYDELLMFCKIYRADSVAHAPEYRERAKTADKIAAIAEEIVRENECFSLRDLAVNGNDMTSLGLSGPEIGEALHELLSLVIDEELPNDKEALIEYIKKKR